MSRGRVQAILAIAALIVAGAILGIVLLGKNKVAVFGDVGSDLGGVSSRAQHPTSLSSQTASPEAIRDFGEGARVEKSEDALVSSQTSDAASDTASQLPPEASPTAALNRPAENAESSLTPAVSSERILLLAPASPLIVELQLTIDGQPHTAALEKLVDDVLKLADADGDGRTGWKELCASKRVKYGQFGNLAIDDDNSEKQVIDRYDIDKDGVVDRTELPRFLTRNAGGSRPFSVRGTLDHQGVNRRGAPTWQILDADDDGVLASADLAAAPARLASRDSDDDEILIPSDLDPRLQIPDPEMMNEQRRRRGPGAIRLLGPYADWSSVQLALEQAYGGSHYLRPDGFPLSPELFGQLDGNQDGRISRNEFPRLNDVLPHLVIAADFGKEKEGEPKSEEGEAPAEPRMNQPRLHLVRVAPALAGSGQNLVLQPGRLTLTIGHATLTFYTNDTVASENFTARAQQALAMFDGNKDGYLEKSEVPEALQAQLGRFEAVDGDEDSKVFPSEIEAYLSQQQAGLRAQIHAKAADSEDALFAALDADHDERLDSREVEGTAQRLAVFDVNRDGQITPDELPEVLVLGLARGSIENADATFRPPPVIIRGPDDKAPRWFTAMDANRDGAISRREFLGSGDKFAELDGDKNGLLELTEAAQAR